MMWVIVYYTFEWKSLPIVWHAFTGMQVRAGRGFLMPCFSSSPSAAASASPVKARRWFFGRWNSSFRKSFTGRMDGLCETNWRGERVTGYVSTCGACSG